MKVLEVKNLRKTIGKREIIKGVDFDINSGEIYGFLGPNGAGKTTTIRMLVGLIKPTHGEIKICGHDLKKDTQKALENVGAVVENPELYKYLSGRENLMQIARIRKVPKEQVQEIIKIIGLEDRIDDKVRKYSLGMKQRLGLGAALLSQPKLLILDEPTNGLDPSGILDFREIVQKAARERDMAVFVSSHILSEVQTLCDKVAFINHGVIQAVEDINKESNTMDTESEVLYVVPYDDKGLMEKKIKELSYVSNCKSDEKGIRVVLHADHSHELIKELVMNDFKIEEAYKERKGLEQRYMELVEGGVR
ncbi:MAG: ABC transporter ATP-binding protein [Clostridium sp.]|nr:ABC transporter ATP-binding protein [Clostridium sp.]